MMAKFKNIFKDSRKRNIAIIFAAAVVILILGVVHFFRGAETLDKGAAKLPRAPGQAPAALPQAAELSQAYLQALMKEQKLTAEEALRLGKSALPAFIAGEAPYEKGVELTPQEQTIRGCCALFSKVCEEKTPAELLNQMVQEGKISPVVASQLSKMEDANASVGDYASALNRLVREGKLTPDQAKQLLAAYQAEHGPKEQVSANRLLDQMVGDGSLSPEAAETLRQLAAKNVSPDDYKKALDKLVQEGKLTPDQAKKLLAAYTRDYQIRKPPPLPPRKNLVDQMLKDGSISQDTAAELRNLEASGKPASEYAAELNRLVREGKLTPDQAKQLLEDYKTAYPGIGLPKGTDEVALAAAREHEQALKAQEESLSRLQQVYRQQQAEKAATETQKALQMAQSAMTTQAKALFASWNPVPQQYVQAPPISPAAAAAAKKAEKEKQEKQTLEKMSTIKAGTIMFAVLDTAVNSDQPAPVMATIVSGKLKGTKLLGNLAQTPDGERVVLKFNLASIPDKPKTVAINAVAINPDTARTAIASDVDHHYLLRYSALFASGFLSGYSKAVLSSGQRILTTQSGEVSETPDISPSGKIMVGLGEVGQQLSTAAKKTFDRKPTVKVNAGVGLGILFTTDVAIQDRS